MYVQLIILLEGLKIDFIMENLLHTKRPVKCYRDYFNGHFYWPDQTPQ